MKKLLFACFILGAWGCNRALSTSNTLKNDEQAEATVSNGYATMRMRDNTGAVSTVDVDNGTITLDNYLRGVAGVNVTGKGSSAKIEVRGVSSFVGSTEPLFVVNGMAIESFATVFNMVSPHDIKRINVLKDAGSTSIYGTRGANGVVVINLKESNSEK